MFRLILCLMAFSPFAYAEEEKLGLSNASELGYVVTGGNAESETTSIKHTSEYKWKWDGLKLSGHYLQSSGLVDTPTPANPDAQSTQITAENWSADLRYEKVLTPKWFSAFLAHGWYGNRFNGVEYGNQTDIGAKYFTANTETFKQFFELGYRYSRDFFTLRPAAGEEKGVGDAQYPEFHLVRMKAQVDYQHSKTFSVGAWLEYLSGIHNFSKDQRLNYSPYITSVLTDMFSLKVAYESRYRYEQPIKGNKLVDYTFTTSLIANF